MATSKVWDNLLSLVTESIDFELLPISPPSPVQLSNGCETHRSWSDSESIDLSTEDEIDGNFEVGISSTRSGRQPPALASADEQLDKPFTGGRCETDGGGEDEIDGECENGNDDAPSAGAGGSPAPSLQPNVPPAAAGGPPPSPARPPPPPPPPGPRIAAVDPHIEAQQEINRMIASLRKNLDSNKTKDGSKSAEDATTLDYSSLDESEKKWADFQARGNKVTVQTFLASASDGRRKVNRELEKLEALISNEELEVMELESVETAAEILGEAAQWFRGGTKELRKAQPRYEKLESTIESFVEFVQLRREMAEEPQEMSYPDVQDRLTYAKKQFEKKHARWGEIIVTDANSWRRRKFPVCDRLLTKCRYYICGLVVRFVRTTLSLTEANKIDMSKENLKTQKAMQRLVESIQLLQTAQLYFIPKHSSGNDAIYCSCTECSEVNPTSMQNGTSDSYNQQALLKLAADVSQSYFEICLGQFEGFVYKQGKERICSQYRLILSLLKKVEDLVSSIPRDEIDSSKKKKKRTVAVITLLPEAEGLIEMMNKSCDTLCRHVESQAKLFGQLSSIKDSPEKREKTKEMVQWMMFYCCYDHQLSTAIGSQQAGTHDQKVAATVQVAFSFIEDNLKQYDNFVRVLDIKRIRGHFDCIMSVVDALVSNIPTADGSPAERSLTRLHSGATLIQPIIRSCEKLVEHYGNHEENVVKGLQADVGEETKKLRKKEATKWLIFGGEYFGKMVGALGPEFNSVMSSFKKLQDIRQRVGASM